jgi:hypothetical protein
MSQTEIADNVIQLTMSSPTAIRENEGELANLYFTSKQNINSEGIFKIENARAENDLLDEITISKIKNAGIKIVAGVNLHSYCPPDELLLYQNYPNPFNWCTKIEYKVGRDSRAVLKLYNIQGQEVKTLVNKEVHFGHYTVQWDGTDDMRIPVPSGLYICKLKAGEFTRVNKIILLK